MKNPQDTSRFYLHQILNLALQPKLQNSSHLVLVIEIPYQVQGNLVDDRHLQVILLSQDSVTRPASKLEICLHSKILSNLCYPNSL